MTASDVTRRPLQSIDALVALVESAPETQARRRPGLTDWSALEVLGHIVDKLTIWRQRIQQITAETEPTLALYDQDVLVAQNAYGEAPVADVVAAVRSAEQLFMTEVRDLTPEVLRRVGHHPDYGTMSIRDCIEIVHTSTAEHLEQARNALGSTPHPNPSPQS